MKVAILQSNYIPWKGYFDLINLVDTFVFYDEAQYTKNDWRNRNIIKTQDGPKWLTIPVNQTYLSQKINETQVHNSHWRKKHWKTLSQNYRKSPFYEKHHDELRDLYLKKDTVFLSEINFDFISYVSKVLNIETTFKWSKEFNLKGDKTEKLVNICTSLKAKEYISGPAAQDYLDESLFKKANIKIKWMDYSNYPIYPQKNLPFIHGVSILDLIFNVEHPQSFMKSFSE